jgi:uncharacterized protein (DUF433 family)
VEGRPRWWGLVSFERGEPKVKGVSVFLLAEMVETLGPEEVLKRFPQLEREDLEAALEYVRVRSARERGNELTDRGARRGNADRERCLRRPVLAKSRLR